MYLRKLRTWTPGALFKGGGGLLTATTLLAERCCNTICPGLNWGTCPPTVTPGRTTLGALAYTTLACKPCVTGCRTTGEDPVGNKTVPPRSALVCTTGLRIWLLVWTTDLIAVVCLVAELFSSSSVKSIQPPSCFTELWGFRIRWWTDIARSWSCTGTGTGDTSLTI